MWEKKIILTRSCHRPELPQQRAGVLSLTIGVVLLSVARNLLARRWPGEMTAVQVPSYGLLLLATLLAAWYARLGARDLGLSWGRFKLRLGGALVLTVVLAAPGLMHGVSALAAVVAVPGALAVATIEELLFRGVLYTLWLRIAGTGSAIVLTSLAFAATHAFLYPLPVILLGLLAGLLLASWRALANDLVAPMLAHTAADAIALAVLRY